MKGSPKVKENKSLKPDFVLPAPEWTALSAQLAASLAHEIRNPLLSIKGAAQLLEQSVSADDKALADLIINEAKRIEQLVATLDPLTPNPQQEMVALNIHELTEYVRLAAESSFGAHVKFIQHYDPSLPPIRGVKEQLIQALMNLTKNAAEAVRNVENPTVTISTRFLVGERMQRVGGRKLTIQVKIEDNGAGVPAAIAPRLFTPFNSGNEGKGLGLAIVAKIIEEHEGLVACESAPDSPAIFSLYLPQA
jgi:two-component system, NtrC family, nitrogen regulation sensor histidine kinase GlnL